MEAIQCGASRQLSVTEIQCHEIAVLNVADSKQPRRTKRVFITSKDVEPGRVKALHAHQHVPAAVRVEQGRAVALRKEVRQILGNAEWNSGQQTLAFRARQWRLRPVRSEERRVGKEC